MLSQSDIFKHFGAGKTLSEAAVAEATQSSVPSGLASPTKRRASAGDTKAAENDDRELMDGEEDEDDEGATQKSKATMLFKQPDCITGGTMR